MLYEFDVFGGAVAQQKQKLSTLMCYYYSATSHYYVAYCYRLNSMVYLLLSVLWRCWLGCRKGIRPIKTEWWGTGVVICLERDASDLHTVQLMPLPPIISCSSKIHNGLPFWCWLTQVVLEKRPLNGCSSSSIVVCLLVCLSRSWALEKWLNQLGCG